MTLTAKQRHALAVIAATGFDGATQTLLTAHGFSIRTIAALVKRGLVTIAREKVRTGGASAQARSKWIDAAKAPITAWRLPLFLAGCLFKPPRQCLVAGSDFAHFPPRVRVVHGLGFGQDLLGAHSQVVRKRQKLFVSHRRHLKVFPMLRPHCNGGTVRHVPDMAPVIFHSGLVSSLRRIMEAGRPTLRHTHCPVRAALPQFHLTGALLWHVNGMGSAIGGSSDVNPFLRKARGV
jgi:hypothetical protein